MTAISIRAAVSADAEDLWRWRNDAVTRAMFRDAAPVPWDAHCAWLDATLRDRNRLLLIGECGAPARKVGMVRFDIDEAARHAEVSINLDPAQRGAGLSKALLAAALRYLAKRRPMAVVAEVRTSNIPSIKCFESVGFVEYDQDARMRRFRLTREALAAI